MDSGVLYLTIAGSFVALTCSSYTVLRSLLPLLSGHSHHTRSKRARATSQPKQPRLKSAQRFAVLLALADVAAVAVLLWETVAAFSTHRQLGATLSARSRLYFALTARPNLLLTIASLSYLNVVRGRQVPLWKADWAVWAPTVLLCGLGAGLASLSPAESRAAWVGLASWLTAVTVLVIACFGRLLLAILRVRHLSQAQASSVPRSLHDEQTLPPDLVRTYHPNMSSLSTSFVRSIGCSSPSPADWAAYAISPEPHSLYRHSSEFARSPTPGSSRFLLDRSTTSSPYSLQLGPILTRGSLEGLSFADGLRDPVRAQDDQACRPIPSANMHQVGASGVQHASSGQSFPDTGQQSSTPVELSAQEARGALIRIGGHLVSALTAYAFTGPFIFSRALKPASSKPAVAAYSMIIGVCFSSAILAWQCAASEGFWFRSHQSVALNSSNAIVAGGEEQQHVIVDMEERSESRATTVRTYQDSVVGIRPDGVDSSPTPKGSLGRAVSMLSTHPKLQLLPQQQHARTSSRSSAVRPPAHARLRSLHLPKLSRGLTPEPVVPPAVPRCVSPAATVGGYEMSTPAPAPAGPRRATEEETLIARSLLRSRKAKSKFVQVERPPEPGLADFEPPLAPAPLEFGFPRRDPPSPGASRPVHPEADETNPKDVEIDFLAAQMLPKLVPSIKVGASVKIGPKDTSMARRRSLPVSSMVEGQSSSIAGGIVGGRGQRRFSTLRNRSLPAFSATPLPPPVPPKDHPTASGRSSSAIAPEARDGDGRCATFSVEPVNIASTDSLADESSVSGFVLLPRASLTPSDISFSTSTSSTTTDDGDDPRTGTIHCATLRPVSRSSSLVAAGGARAPFAQAKMQHAPTRSFDTLSSSTVTDESFADRLTFPDRLSFGVWQDRPIELDTRRLSVPLSTRSRNSLPGLHSASTSESHDSFEDHALCETLEDPLPPATEEDAIIWRGQESVLMQSPARADENSPIGGVSRGKKRLARPPSVGFSSTPVRSMR
ncbi:hypothetical protein JCM10908_001718 [Rhodotorula pacifica]|uniref:uncharacterized protein n=1 Tax=Rhodotorula pacifica TaxID=1495444 RepID=UPI0031743B0A